MGRIQRLSSGRRRRVLGGGYVDRVLGTGPVAYWPLSETSGTVARCLVNTAQNGTYSSDVSAMGTGAGIGDGNTAAYFDGANDYVNIYTETLRDAFNGAEGSVLFWQRANSAAMWSDASLRRPLYLGVNADNRVYLQCPGDGSGLVYAYEANNVVEGATQGGAEVTTGDWQCAAITWSASADEVVHYFNGTARITRDTLGVWAGQLAANTTCIGAGSTVPASPWHGWAAHCVIWTRALGAGEIADFYSV